MVIDVPMPRGWGDLTGKQLMYLYSLLSSGLDADTVCTYALFRWGKLDPSVVSATAVAEVLPLLYWMTGVPDRPVRPERIGKKGKYAARYDAQCHGLNFETYLAIENYYQGYLHTRREDLADAMAALLYASDGAVFTDAERLAVLYWWAGLKQYLAVRFNSFFRPAGEEARTGDIGRRLQHETDVQIRALTGGDITKNDAVLKAGIYTVLTELNEKSLESLKFRSLGVNG